MAVPAGLRCLLIGGALNVGKSTVAGHLGEQLGWTHVSTDTLGRHPGRPWGVVPDHVTAHYTRHSDAEIFDALMMHQRGMWRKIEALVRERAGDGLVLEGSAILPAETATLGLAGVASVWLISGEGFRRERINAASGYAGADAAARQSIDRFIERNRRLDAYLRAEAERLALPLVEVEGKSVAEVALACLAVYSPET